MGGTLFTGVSGSLGLGVSTGLLWRTWGRSLRARRGALRACLPWGAPVRPLALRGSGGFDDPEASPVEPGMDDEGLEGGPPDQQAGQDFLGDPFGDPFGDHLGV